MDAPWATISSSTGGTLPWVKELRYLGVHILQSRTFKCSLSNHRKAFYRSANAIFGKIGRTKDVILQLIKSKCIPSLLYSFDACADCALTKLELYSLDFILNMFFMKLFKTNNIDVVKSCNYISDSACRVRNG